MVLKFGIRPAPVDKATHVAQVFAFHVAAPVKYYAGNRAVL
jgi:hypothetical protein